MKLAENQLEENLHKVIYQVFLKKTLRYPPRFSPRKNNLQNTQLSGKIFDTYSIPNLNILYVPISDINKVMILLYDKQILYSQKLTKLLTLVLNIGTVYTVVMADETPAHRS